MRITIDVPDSQSLDNKAFVGSVLAAALGHLDKMPPPGMRIFGHQSTFVKGPCIMHLAVSRTIDRDCSNVPCIHQTLSTTATAHHAMQMTGLLHHVEELMLKSHTPMTRNEAMQETFMQLRKLMDEGKLTFPPSPHFDLSNL